MNTVTIKMLIIKMAGLRISIFFEKANEMLVSCELKSPKGLTSAVKTSNSILTLFAISL